MKDKTLKSTNIPSMTVGEMRDRLTELYGSVIKNGGDIQQLPSVMLWGPPGVGKSQSVREIASSLEESTGKKICVTDVRLLLFNPIDLRGIPTANEDKTLAIWLKPQIFQMDPSDDIINILFLDEISAAPQSVQAAAYQIVLDKDVGEHRLPRNCIVIAAGNRVTDKSVAYKMPKALANRLLHIEVKQNFDSWREWAVQKGINDKVLGFLTFRQDLLMGFDPSTDDLAFATPRAWEMVSEILNMTGGDVSRMFPMIAGLVGEGTAIEFRTWAKVYKGLPSVEGIFDGSESDVPVSTDALYALTSSMTTYAAEHSGDMDKIANSVRYAQKLPPDYSALLLKNYLYIRKDYMSKLMTIPEFRSWLDRTGRLMNGTFRH